MQSFTLPAQYLRQIVGLVGDMGADVPGWLARAQLHEARLGDSDLHLSLATFERLIEDAGYEPRQRTTQYEILGRAATEVAS